MIPQALVQEPLQDTLNFQIIINKSKTNTVTDDNISISRQITMNHDRILGSEDEEAQTINAMRQDAVLQILYKIQHLTQG